MSEADPSCDVFISYARRDHPHMQRVRSLVRGLLPGSAVFVDVDSLRAGRKWEAQLRHAIEGSAVFVVIWSWHGRDSLWVQREVAIALEAAERTALPRIIPVVADRTPLAGRLAEYEAISAGLQDEAPISLAAQIGVISAVLLLPFGSTLAAHLNGWDQWLPLTGLLSMWLALLPFQALRSMRAPWNAAEHRDGYLLGVIRLRVEALTLLMVGAVLSSLFALLLSRSR